MVQHCRNHFEHSPSFLETISNIVHQFVKSFRKLFIVLKIISQTFRNLFVHFRNYFEYVSSFSKSFRKLFNFFEIISKLLHLFRNHFENGSIFSKSFRNCFIFLEIISKIMFSGKQILYIYIHIYIYRKCNNENTTMLVFGVARLP